MLRKNVFKKIGRMLIMMLIFSFVIIPQTGCGNKEPLTGTDEYLDTRCEITVFGLDEGDAKEIISGGFQVIQDNEALLSKTIKGSDVYKINAAEGRKTKVSEATAETVSLGIEMGKLSNGSFDITIGRLTDLWDFKAEDPSIPPMEAVNEAKGTVDFENVVAGKNQVRLKNSDSEIDLGGIAKGYIADRVTDYLDSQKVENAIINLGGNVVAIGTRDDGNPFEIGIERPYSDRTEIIGSISASDKTVVTSGIYERKFEKNGVMYHHIIDPATGFPVKTDLEAVVIVAEKGNSAFCDGLSTACLMEGVDGAWELVKKMQDKYPERHIEAAFIDKDDKVIKTKGMEIHPAE